jgi:flagellar basal-body rod protein FlgC
MRVNLNFGGFAISSTGMNINKKKMDLIAENIANSETTKTESGGPYQRKYLSISNMNDNSAMSASVGNTTLPMRSTNPNHLGNQTFSDNLAMNDPKIDMKEAKDQKEGDVVYMPEHPDANESGYVQMPNVNIVTEMVDMIAATRGYEANVTAFNASKQIAKDSLEI